MKGQDQWSPGVHGRLNSFRDVKLRTTLVSLNRYDLDEPDKYDGADEVGYPYWELRDRTLKRNEGVGVWIETTKGSTGRHRPGEENS